MEIEPSKGTASVLLDGGASAKFEGEDKFIDAVDAAYPPTEPAAFFIATQLILTPKQKMEEDCPIPMLNCTKDADCEGGTPTKPGKCDIPNKKCKEVAWCPAEERVSSSGKSKTQVLKLEGVSDFLVWFKASIIFLHLSPNEMFTTMKVKQPVMYPLPGYNTMKVRDILKLSKTVFEDVKDSGGVFIVNAWWECRIKKGATNLCNPKVKVMRLDTDPDNEEIPGSGFQFTRANYYRDGEDEFRDQLSYIGLRFFLLSSGLATCISVPFIILQFSSGLALLSVASAGADYVMLYVLPKKEIYARKKMERTPDFSEFIGAGEEAEEDEGDEEGALTETQGAT